MHTKSRHTQPEVLKVTGIKPAVLQTWINRGAIDLAEQNPGSGRRRLYSELDVVKLAIMRRLADLRVDLKVGKEIAEETAALLTKDGEVPWGLCLFIQADEMDFRPLEIEVQGKRLSPLFTKYGGAVIDFAETRLEFAVGEVVSKARRQKISLPKDAPDNRTYWARKGVHFEPAIVFPLGEIVNGTLLQLEALINSENDEATD